MLLILAVNYILKAVTFAAGVVTSAEQVSILVTLANVFDLSIDLVYYLLVTSSKSLFNTALKQGVRIYANSLIKLFN